MILKELANDAFVIDKPAGVSTHTPDGGLTPGFLEMAAKILGRPLWAVHRLDSGTSGCLLVTAAAANVDIWTHVLAKGKKNMSSYHHMILETPFGHKLAVSKKQDPISLPWSQAKLIVKQLLQNLAQ